MINAMNVQKRKKERRRKSRKSELTELSSEKWGQASVCRGKEKPQETLAPDVRSLPVSAVEKENAIKKYSLIDVIASSSQEGSQISQSCEEMKEIDAPEVESLPKSTGKNNWREVEYKTSPKLKVDNSLGAEKEELKEYCRDTERFLELEQVPVEEVESILEKVEPVNEVETIMGERRRVNEVETISEEEDVEFSNQDQSEERIEESLELAVGMADLTCSACLKPFKDPKVLPCFHSCCHDCIVNLIKDTNTINCPKCRLAVQVDENTVTALPSNFFVNNILATMALKNDKPSTKRIFCENCNSEHPVAESRCNVCGIFLCQYCTESHKRYRSTEHHKLLSMEELKSKPGPQTIAEKIRCQKHKEEVIKLFCKTCQTTICRDCTIVDHRQHEYGFVEEVASSEKEHLQSNLTQVKQRKGRLVLGIANLKEFNKNLEDKKNSTISEINKHFDELVKAAEFRKREMVQKTTSLTNSKQKQIRAQLEVLEVALATCESSIEFTELAFKSGNDVQILSMEKNILQSLQQLKSVQDQTKPSVTENMMFVIPFSLQETKNNLLNKYDVDVSIASPEKCHAYFNEVEAALPKKAGALNNRHDMKQELGQKLKDNKDHDVMKEDWDNEINQKGRDYEKPERFIEAGKQYFIITLICNDKNNGRLRYGGDDIQPSFTGVDVNDIVVADNKDGSYSISFCPRQGGMLKFEVSINGVPAPNCSLTKQVRWIISGAHGKGVITDGGRTMKGEVGDGKFCWRVGGCYFESGVHTWKVRLDWQDTYRDMRCYGYNHYGYLYNSVHSNEVEVGIIDYNEISEDDVERGKKWVYKQNVQDRYSKEISFTLDMEKRTLNVTTGSKFNCPACVMNDQFTAPRVSPFFGCSSPYVSISLLE